MDLFQFLRAVALNVNLVDSSPVTNTSPLVLLFSRNATVRSQWSFDPLQSTPRSRRWRSCSTFSSEPSTWTGGWKRRHMTRRVAGTLFLTKSLLVSWWPSRAGGGTLGWATRPETGVALKRICHCCLTGIWTSRFWALPNRICSFGWTSSLQRTVSPSAYWSLTVTLLFLVCLNIVHILLFQSFDFCFIDVLMYKQIWKGKKKSGQMIIAQFFCSSFVVKIWQFY